MANCISSMLRHELAIESICSTTRRIDAATLRNAASSSTAPQASSEKPHQRTHGLPRFGAVGFFCGPDAWNLDDPSLPFRTQTLL